MEVVELLYWNKNTFCSISFQEFISKYICSKCRKCHIKVWSNFISRSLAFKSTTILKIICNQLKWKFRTSYSCYVVQELRCQIQGVPKKWVWFNGFKHNFNSTLSSKSYQEQWVPKDDLLSRPCHCWRSRYVRIMSIDWKVDSTFQPCLPASLALKYYGELSLGLRVPQHVARCKQLIFISQSACFGSIAWLLSSKPSMVGGHRATNVCIQVFWKHPMYFITCITYHWWKLKTVKGYIYSL